MSTATVNSTDVGGVAPSSNARRSGSINRTWAIMRMQLVNKMTFIWTPLIIIAGSFLLSLTIWLLIPEAARENGTLAGSQAVFWYLVPVGVMTMSYTFPFSQGMSVSRRSFYIGSVATFALFAAALSVFFFVLGLIERATDGWGSHATFFSLWVRDYPWYEGLGLVFGLALVLCMLGFAFATVYKRWGALGLVLSCTVLGVVLVAGVALATWNELWPQVGAWFAAQTPGTVALWSIAVAAVTALASYAILRKTTP